MEIDKHRLFRVILTNEEVFLRYKNPVDPKASPILSINLSKNEIKKEKYEILETKSIIKKYKAKAILGIINIKEVEFVLFVTSSEIIGQMKEENIYRISEVDFCEIPNKRLNKSEYIDEDQIKYIKDGISKLLKLGFYYSFGLDLTNSQQNQSKILYNLKKKKSGETLKNENNEEMEKGNNNLELKIKKIYKTIYKKYFFNYNLYEKLRYSDTSQPIDYTFITPIICGYVGIFDYELDKKKFQFILITRRSQNYAGTRYNTRGINDDGNVANFCESEQILIYENIILCSFCQLRGSVPIFFEQIGLTATTDITRNKNLTIDAFTRHLEEINKDFSLIYFINLLNQKKSIEAPIISEFEKQIKFRKENNKFRYIYFDMQNECQKDNYSRIDNLINTISPTIELFGFFSCNIKTNEIFSIQKGTPRTNCLDCLDRTNVVQTRISWKILEKMFKFLKIDQKNIANIFKNEENFFSVGSNNLKEKFKDIWADNGDIISIQYSGTASTITTVTKTGGHNIKGFFKHSIATVTRLYQGNFEDEFKQQCIDILLQKNINDKIISLEYNNELYLRKSEFTKFMDFILFIGNFNLSEKSLDNVNDILNWLTTYKNVHFEENNQKEVNELKNKLPEFYILGFEEIKSNSEKQIKEIIIRTLNKINNNSNDPYQFMKELYLSGIYILIYVKASCIKYIKNFDQQLIKKSYVGNKGSCLIRFNINDTTIALSCNHLSYGEDKNEERKEEIKDILNSSFKKYPKLNFKNHDYFFLFGDLNIRLNLWLNDQLMLDLVKNSSREINGDFSQLYSHDQFLQYQNESTIISEMCEAIIKFSPTYKYNIGSTSYDVTKRTPSWCDRIFYKKYSKTIPLAYNKCLLTISDHQPIFGVYKIRTEIINKEEKQNILNQMIKEKEKKNDLQKEKNKINDNKTDINNSDKVDEEKNKNEMNINENINKISDNSKTNINNNKDSNENNLNENNCKSDNDNKIIENNISSENNISNDYNNLTNNNNSNNMNLKEENKLSENNFKTCDYNQINDNNKNNISYTNLIDDNRLLKDKIISDNNSLNK